MLLLFILILELISLPATGALGIFAIFFTLMFGEGISNGDFGKK